MEYTISLPDEYSKALDELSSESGSTVEALTESAAMSMVQDKVHKEKEVEKLTLLEAFEAAPDTATKEEILASIEK